MMNAGNMIIWLLISLVALVLGGVAGYLVRNYLLVREQTQKQLEADHIIALAREQAQEIELQAKDKALQIRQSADQDISRRRAEVTREEDRLQKRREEIDNRTDRLEKREQAINKRQSALDKRANDVEKLYEKEMEELQRISEMTTDDAR